VAAVCVPCAEVALVAPLGAGVLLAPLLMFELPFPPPLQASKKALVAVAAPTVAIVLRFKKLRREISGDRPQYRNTR